MKKTIFTILIIFFLTSSLQTGGSADFNPIHTRITFINLDFTTRSGGDQYGENVTIIEFDVNVEVWNTDDNPQEVGYFWFVPSCEEFLTVEANISDTVNLYNGTPAYLIACDYTLKLYEPGVTFETAKIQLIFDAPNLQDIPSGNYKIFAPTSNGNAYYAILRSLDGRLSYQLESRPQYWGTNSSLISTVLACTGNCHTTSSSDSGEINNNANNISESSNENSETLNLPFYGIYSSIFILTIIKKKIVNNLE